MLNVAGARAEFHDRICGMIGAEDVVQVALPEVAVIHARGER